MVRGGMAIFRLNATIISAGRGTSAVCAAAYRHAVRMVSLGFGDTRSFTHKAQAMVHAEVALPEDAPEWAENAFGHAAFADALRLVRADVQAQGSDMSEAAMQRAAMARVSERLWQAVEHGENRLNKFSTRAQYARSLTVALPRELDQAAQIALMQGYVRVSFSDRGMVADWVIHDKSDGNPHAHIMLTTRELGAADWGRKRRDWNTRDVLSDLRSDWAQHANLALERAGLTSALTTVQTMRGGFTWSRTAIIRMWPVMRDARAKSRAKRTGARMWRMTTRSICASTRSIFWWWCRRSGRCLPGAIS